MRVLADENTPAFLVEHLQAIGHEVTEIRTTAHGSRDEQVLAIAIAQRAVLVTFDLDFGQLVYQQGLPFLSIVLVRRMKHTPEDRQRVTNQLAALLAAHGEELSGAFAVLDTHRIRIRRPAQG